MKVHVMYFTGKLVILTENNINMCQRHDKFTISCDDGGADVVVVVVVAMVVVPTWWWW